MKKIFVFVLLSSVAVASYAQEADYSNYMVLDSIKYESFRRWDSSMRSYIEKYEYTKNGIQGASFVYSGPVGGSRGLETFYDWYSDANDVIIEYQDGEFSYTCNYHANGMLSSIIAAHRWGSYPNDLVLTFDSKGRKTYECGNYMNAATTSMEYGTNGLPSCIEFESHDGTRKYENTYNENGLLLRRTTSHVQDLSPKGFDVFETELWEYQYVYDDQSCLIQYSEKVLRTLDHEDEAYINSLSNNYQSGREVYEELYNHWHTSMFDSFYTDIDLDSNGRIAKRTTWEDGYAEPYLTEAFEYDELGNEISRILETRDLNFDYFGYTGFKKQCNYDHIGRIICEQLEFNGLGQKLQIYDFNYAYDESGNQINKGDFVRHAPYWFFYPAEVEYNHDGNIISEVSETGEKYTYTYDGQGRLTAKSLYIVNHLTGEYEPYEKYTYNPEVPAIKSGAQMPFGDDFSVLLDWIQVYAWHSRPVYKFDEPYMMTSYTKYINGEEVNVELFYSPFVKESDGIEVVNAGNTVSDEYYDLRGHRFVSPQNGINIMRMSDGTIRKFINKH